MKKLWARILEIANKIGKDRLGAYAGSSALFIIMSFLPFVLLLVTLLRFTPVTEEILVLAATRVFPTNLTESISALIHQMYQSVSVTGYVLIIGSLLWTAGKGFHSLINGLNSIYEIKENRNWFLVRLVAIGYTLIFLIMVVICLVLYIIGRNLRDHLLVHSPIIGQFLATLMHYRWPILVVVLTLFFWLMYSFIPNKKKEFRLTIPGAVFASIGWAGFSYFFSLYTEYSPNMTIIYGSLTTIICAMLWVYVCMSIFLFGAEVNVFIERWVFRTNLNYDLKKREGKVLK